MTRYAKYLRLACRICAELGAHFVKTYYAADGFETVTASCPVPVVMAGGRKLPELEALSMAAAAIERGAAGVDMGRNIFQSEDPRRMLRAVLAVVHDGAGPGAAANLVIAQLLGGVSGEGAGIQGHELARLLAIACPESRVHYLHAPLLVDSAQIRASMLQDRSIRASLDAAARSDLALVGIGNLEDSAPLVRYGHLSALDRRRLRKAGAIGDVCARFFTVEGEPVRELDDRLLAVDWETLRKTRSVVAVAAGADKVEATLGALRGGVVSSLVTDEWTAEEILRGEGS